MLTADLITVPIEDRDLSKAIAATERETREFAAMVNDFLATFPEGWWRNRRLQADMDSLAIEDYADGPTHIWHPRWGWCDEFWIGDDGGIAGIPAKEQFDPPPGHEPFPATVHMMLAAQPRPLLQP